MSCWFQVYSTVVQNVYILFPILSPYRLLQNTEYSALSYAVGPCRLPISHIGVCVSEKAMAPHSSTVAWKIPWMEELGGLQSMGSWRVGHLLGDFIFTFHFHALEKEMAIHSSLLAWRIPGSGSLMGCRLWGRRVRHDWSDLSAAACLKK